MLAQCSKTFIDPIRSVVISTALEAATLIQRSQTRAPSRVAAFLIARHEERTQVRDETNTCFFTRRGKKKRNYMRKAFEVQTFRKKMKMLEATSDFPCCNCACLPKSFIHTEEKRKKFSLMVKVFQANVFSHVMERTPVLGYPRRVVIYKPSGKMEQ